MEINSNFEDTTMKINGPTEFPQNNNLKDIGEDSGQQSENEGQRIAKDRESLTQSDEMGEEQGQQQEEQQLDMVDPDDNDVSGNQYYGLGQQPQNTKRYWNAEEDLNLTKLVRQFGAKNWKKIASYLDQRTDV